MIAEAGRDFGFLISVAAFYRKSQRYMVYNM
jgi:hypothetical protein